MAKTFLFIGLMKMDMLLPYITNIFDYAIIAFFIYLFYKTFKGTQILRIFFLFICLFALKKIATDFHLVLTSKALGLIIDNSLILMLVMFQDDIKKFFNRIYKTFENLNNQKYITSSEILAECCESLAKKKTGALILIERSLSLKAIVSKGVLLNSDLSKELLLTIFDKKSILHDGAVIISKDRIISASNLTPLTKNENFDLKYGTRHRSAIGISEISDCISIIVSEERGEIRVSEGGKLSPSLNKEELKALLDSHLSSNQAESNKLGLIADSVSEWARNLFKRKNK